MASNSKICKLKISLSDVDRNHYDSLNLTVAVDEPDIWARSLDDQLLLWVDVGNRCEYAQVKVTGSGFY
jgi:uncharacterized protein YaeQ